MKILICGSRYWTNREIIRKELEKLPPETVVIEGGNGTYDKTTGKLIRGADKIAAEVANDLGMEVIEFPANWDGMEALGKPRNAAGPIRNTQMLKEGKPDRVIAFHEDWENSKDTKDMLIKARITKLPIKIINNRGELVREIR